MSFILKKLTDIDKNSRFYKFNICNPKCEICYMFYNKNKYKILYIGATTQSGTKKINYLKNHHNMGKLELNFLINIEVYIYLKYSENYLIKFLKPEYNKTGGSLLTNCRNDINIFEIIYKNNQKFRIFDNLNLYKLDLFDSIKKQDCYLLKIWGFTSKNNIGINFGFNHINEYDYNCYRKLKDRFESNKLLYIFGNKYKNDKKIILLLNKINNIKNSIGNILPNHDIIISKRLLSIISYCDNIYFKECMYIILNSYLEFLEENIKKNNFKCRCGKIYKTLNGLCKHLHSKKCFIASGDHEMFFSHTTYVIICNIILDKLIIKKYLSKNFRKDPQIWSAYRENILCTKEYEKFVRSKEWIDKVTDNKYKRKFILIKKLI